MRTVTFRFRNPKGYDIAKQMPGKFSYISPCWFEILPTADSVKLNGEHDVDKVSTLPARSHQTHFISFLSGLGERDPKQCQIAKCFDSTNFASGFARSAEERLPPKALWRNHKDSNKTGQVRSDRCKVLLILYFLIGNFRLMVLSWISATVIIKSNMVFKKKKKEETTS